MSSSDRAKLEIENKKLEIDLAHQWSKTALVVGTLFLLLISVVKGVL